MTIKAEAYSPFGIDIDEKVTFFVEGANLHGLSKAINMQVDYAKLLKHFKNYSRFVRANYYTAMVEDAEYNSIRPLIDWLSYNGYNVLTKPAKEFTDSMGRRKVKGNVDIEMAVDMMESAKFSDHIVLFSGDGDFTAVVGAVQRMGVRVTVVSSIAMASDDLRRRADNFVELEKVRSLIEKPVDTERPARSRISVGASA
jgi:uncharacterized LabA/DUF88 family protein